MHLSRQRNRRHSRLVAARPMRPHGLHYRSMTAAPQGPPHRLRYSPMTAARRRPPRRLQHSPMTAVQQRPTPQTAPQPGDGGTAEPTAQTAPQPDDGGTAEATEQTAPQPDDGGTAEATFLGAADEGSKESDRIEHAGSSFTIVEVLPRDRILAIFDPVFMSAEAAADSISERDLVIGLSINDSLVKTRFEEVPAL